MKLFDEKKEADKRTVHEELVKRLKKIAGILNGTGLTEDEMKIVNSWSGRYFLKTKTMEVAEEIIGIESQIPLFLDQVIHLQNAFQAISELEFHLKSKQAILNYIVHNWTNCIRDVSAHTYVQPPKVIAQQYPGKIEFSDYKCICSSKKINYSEFVLLTCGLIANFYAEKVPAEIEKFLSVIRINYFLGNYQNCQKYLLKLINTRSDIFPEKNRTEILEFVRNVAKNLIQPDPYYVHERRYLESRAAALVFSDQNMKKSIIKIAKNLFKKDITSDQDLESFLGFTTDKNFIDPSYRGYFDNFMVLHNKVKPEFQIILEGVKPEKKGEVEPIDPVASGNPSVMRAYSPAFYDDKSPLRLYAKTDVTTYNPKNPKDRSRYSLYVHGRSGHIRDLMGTLMCYIEQNRNDPDLSKDINYFIIASIAFYIKRGYHSFGELAYIFQYPVVEYVMNQRTHEFNPIKINFNFPPPVLKAAFADAQEYMKAIGLPNALRTEFMNIIDPTQSPVDKPDAKVLSHESDDNWTFGDIDNDDSKEDQKPLADDSVLKKLKLKSQKPADKNSYQKMAEFQSALELKLSSWGGRDVVADGNCFFYAAMDQLKRHQLHNEGEILCELVALDIAENPSEYKELKNLMKSDAWGDGFFVGKALARIKNVIVVIIPNDEKSNPVIFKPEGAKTVITLGYEVGRRYQSLIQAAEKRAKLDQLIESAETIPAFQIKPNEAKEGFKRIGLLGQGKKKAGDVSSPSPSLSLQ